MFEYINANLSQICIIIFPHLPIGLITAAKNNLLTFHSFMNWFIIINWLFLNDSKLVIMQVFNSFTWT